MSNKRRLVFRICAVLVLLLISACMMVIGRGHTMYFDNKKLDYEGQTVDAVRRINVSVNGEQVAMFSSICSVNVIPERIVSTFG